MITKRLIIAIFELGIILFFSISLSAQNQNINIAHAIFDIVDAKEYCDESPLLRIEGIWEFPTDGTKVLIKRQSPSSYTCDIILLSSPDCRLYPGDDIGDISPAGTPGTYSLSLCRSRVKGILTDPSKCTAKLNASNSLSFKPKKYTISIGTLWFLPKFWRSLRVRQKNKNDDIDNGMIRIYPPTEAAPSQEIIYL